MNLNFKLYLVATSIGFNSLSVHAAPSCADLFSKNAEKTVLGKLTDQVTKLKDIFKKNNDVISWEKYHPNEVSEKEMIHLDILKKLFTNPKNFAHSMSYPEALQLLRDSDLPLYGQVLTEITQKLSTTPDLSLVNFKQALTEVLTSRHYTVDIIHERIKALSSIEKINWRKILGDLSVTEVHQMFYGNNALKPTETSLIGQYLALTQAQTKIMQFPAVHGKPELGPAKLVVTVSAESFEQFKSIVLSNNHFMTVVGHANVIHNGSFYSYGGTKSDIRATGIGTPFPLLLVKTTEAQRLTRYMELTTDPNYKDWYGNNPLKKPWYLENYCARGGYECCTHWLGNIPIGDKLVNEYSFPGKVDHGAGELPRSQPLKEYQIDPNNENLKNVWKVPGHQQLSNLIGQKEANDIGEMASPGYVIHTLMGPTKAAYVPVVFIMTADHKAPIPEKPLLEFEMPR